MPMLPLFRMIVFSAFLVFAPNNTQDVTFTGFVGDVGRYETQAVLRGSMSTVDNVRGWFSA